jgi:hypothetical protein
MKEGATPHPFIDVADLRVLRSFGDAYTIPSERERVKGIHPTANVDRRERHRFATSGAPEYFR